MAAALRTAVGALLLLGALGAAPEERALAADDECAAGAACALEALQLRREARAAEASGSSGGGAGGSSGGSRGGPPVPVPEELVGDGGLGKTYPAHKDVQDLCDSVKAEAEKQGRHAFAKFRAVSYRARPVAGTRYFVKVDVGGGHYIHVRIFWPLPGMNEDPSLEAAKIAGKDDPLEDFY